MMLVIDGGEIFAPQPLGELSILTAGERVAALGADVAGLRGLPLERLCADDCYVVPGFVDGLTHITGGGGEGGFATRTPEMRLTDAVLGGVTTMVGALGTDAITQTLPALLAKARALESEGLTCYCYTGSYQVPVRTLLSTVQEDIVLVDRFVGVGEVAISDHRSSHPSCHELTRLASEARVGGMLAGKAGIVMIHTGDADTRLTPLLDVVRQSALPLTQFWPTHINRSSDLLQAGIDFAQKGGVIDFTASTTPDLIAAGDIPCVQALSAVLEAGVSVEQVTFTTDGHASLPRFDAQGQLIGLQIGRMDSLLTTLRQCVLEAGFALGTALLPITQNPAERLKLPRKGRLAVGADADLLVLEKRTLALRHVVARGRVMLRDGLPVCRGYFD